MVVTQGTELSPAGLPEAFKDAVELGFRQTVPRMAVRIFTGSEAENLIHLHHSLSTSLTQSLSTTTTPPPRPVAVVRFDPGENN